MDNRDSCTLVTQSTSFKDEVNAGREDQSLPSGLAGSGGSSPEHLEDDIDDEEDEMATPEGTPSIRKRRKTVEWPTTSAGDGDPPPPQSVTEPLLGGVSDSGAVPVVPDVSEEIPNGSSSSLAKPTFDFEVDPKMSPQSTITTTQSFVATSKVAPSDASAPFPLKYDTPIPLKSKSSKSKLIKANSPNRKRSVSSPPLPTAASWSSRSADDFFSGQDRTNGQPNSRPGSIILQDQSEAWGLDSSVIITWNGVHPTTHSHNDLLSASLQIPPSPDRKDVVPLRSPSPSPSQEAALEERVRNQSDIASSSTSMPVSSSESKNEQPNMKTLIPSGVGQSNTVSHSHDPLSSTPQSFTAPTNPKSSSASSSSHPTSAGHSPSSAATNRSGMVANITKVIFTTTRMQPVRNEMANLWEYFRGELHSTDFDESYDVKKERVQNFLSVPFHLEKLLWFGLVICLDSFLYVFTILPLRVVIALYELVKYLFSRNGTMKAAQKCDLMKGALFVMCCYMLQHVDASRVYHSVRGQAVIKLYVIFNVLEATVQYTHPTSSTVANSGSGSNATRTMHRRLNRFTHFGTATLYIFAHSIILFYMVMTLNVAVNSYSNALLTLLLSNQFVEIKGSVFKKFEKENLFQMSCSDIVERFQLSVFMVLITIRNYLELTGGGGIDAAITYFYSFSASIFAPSTILSALVDWESYKGLFAMFSGAGSATALGDAGIAGPSNVTAGWAAWLDLVLRTAFGTVGNVNGGQAVGGFFSYNATATADFATSTLSLPSYFMNMVLLLAYHTLVTIPSTLLALVLAILEQTLRVIASSLFLSSGSGNSNSTFTFPFAIPISPSHLKMLETLLTPVIVVLGTEVIVDWLKHAFITKFNQIRVDVYGRFGDSLCRDLVGGDIKSLIGRGGSVGSEGRERSKRERDDTSAATDGNRNSLRMVGCSEKETKSDYIGFLFQKGRCLLTCQHEPVVE
ncbi:hypothetical protein HK102_008824 [Quaeritorhiza haematococci]|nr:hypothetical protein HK102_008824 [Quaeritorhiza haematococci]